LIHLTVGQMASSHQTWHCGHLCSAQGICFE
jgi:hypothetical protein